MAQITLFILSAINLALQSPLAEHVSILVAGTTGRVVIHDMASRTFERVMDWLYGSELRLHWSDAVELLIASDRYGMVDLFNACTRFVADSVSELNTAPLLGQTDNIEELLGFAQAVGCTEVEQVCACIAAFLHA